MFFAVLFSVPIGASNDNKDTAGLTNMEKLSDLLQRVEPELLTFQRLNPHLQLEHGGELWKVKKPTAEELDAYIKQLKAADHPNKPDSSAKDREKIATEPKELSQYDKDLARLQQTPGRGIPIGLGLGFGVFVVTLGLCRRRGAADPQAPLSGLGADEADSNPDTDVNELSV
jgi:hypothetical protein